MPSDESRSGNFRDSQSYIKGRAMRALAGRHFAASRETLAVRAERRYSLRVGIIRSSVRSSMMVACGAFTMSCAQSTAPPELPITAHVMLSRVLSAEVPPRPSDCTIETLTALPTQPYRELGMIQISAADESQHDTRVIIDQHACAMGADAVLMSPAQATSRGGLLKATAIAYASGIADRVAKAHAAEEAAAKPTPIPKSPVPEVEQITPAGLPQSSSAAAAESEEELPPQTLVPIRELEIGPAEAPAPTRAATPSAPTAMQSPAPSTSPTPTPATTPAATVAPPSSMLTPVPIPIQGLPPASTAIPSPIPAATPLPEARHKD
jgi:hypothetical protein